MKKLITVIDFTAIVTFLGTILIACVFPNLVPFALRKVLIVSFAVSIIYCLAYYKNPIKHVG